MIPTMNDDEKKMIDILLKEYDTLRQEIVSRINTRFTLLNLSLIALTFVAVQLKGETKAIWAVVVLVGIFIVFATVWWSSGLLVCRLSRQVAVLEKRINSVAGQELLTWEHQVASRNLLHKLTAKLSDETLQAHAPIASQQPPSGD